MSRAWYSKRSNLIPFRWDSVLKLPQRAFNLPSLSPLKLAILGYRLNAAATAATATAAGRATAITAARRTDSEALRDGDI
jgi:hypothetical protein